MQPAPPRPGDREARKRAEKRRRTVLNELVAELAALLPLVADSQRKVDKTGVLRLAAHEIRKEHVFGDAVAAARPFGADVADAFLDLVDGFLLTVTARGIVLVASPNVQRHLGHAPLDLLGHSLLALAHPADARALRQRLWAGAERAAEAPRCDFAVRLARAAGAGWAACRVRGGWRRADRARPPAAASPAAALAAPPARRPRARRDRALAPAGNDWVLVALVRVLARPAPRPPLAEPERDEYWTRHLVDGRIVHCDQRISLVAGYMSAEVTGVSAFTFMHREDVRWVVIALRQMYDQSKPYGESYYRLVSRTGRFVYLRSRGYLEIDPTTKAAQSFVCINSLMSDEEGAAMIAEMKRRYSAIVDADPADERLRCEAAAPGEETGLEDPRRLEQVIMHLIANLPAPSPASSPARGRDALTIIPPKPSSIKSSIRKSVSVVGGGGARRPPAAAALGADG